MSQKTIVITMMILIALGIFIETAMGTRVILQDCDDTYLRGATNRGNLTYFWLNLADRERPLLKFDLSSIPSTAKIVKAELSLYADLHASYEEPIDPFIMPLLQ